MPRRQLANVSIESLETLFDGKRTAPDVLTTLMVELSHRKTARARGLERRVRQALSVQGVEAPPRPTGDA